MRFPKRMKLVHSTNIKQNWDKRRCIDQIILAEASESPTETLQTT